MRESRRRLLLKIFASCVLLGFLFPTLGAQEPVPSSRRRPDQKDDSNSSVPKPDEKVILEANQKDIKKDVERLYQLASELKAQVEKTDSVNVLSLPILKKTEEIEKLAREIRSRAKG